jgi:hypothetical protein
VATVSRPSVHKPLTKSYAIDQITDIERLRKVAHRMWEAFLACDRYHEWQKKITDGFGSV